MHLDRVPYELDAGPVRLRAWDPREVGVADLLFSVIDENREFLGRFLPMTDRFHEPKDAVTFLRNTRARFEAMQDFLFGIWAKDEGRVTGRLVGGSALLVRGEPEAVGMEIGYWLREGETGKGFALAAAKTLAKLALEVGAQRVVVRCDPENVASRKVAEKLGFVFEGVARRSMRLREQARDLAIYSLVPGEGAFERVD